MSKEKEFNREGIDPRFQQLLRDIRGVVESKYVELEEVVTGWHYDRTRDDDPKGVVFASLHHRYRLDILGELVPWSDYYDDGILTEHQANRIVSNVLDGKPEKNWLEGIETAEAWFKDGIAAFEKWLREYAERSRGQPNKEKDKGIDR
jgi:hypothetical protein